MAESFLHLDPRYHPLFRREGLDIDTLFTHPDVAVWRSIPERENATLDATDDDGRPVRLHIKRYRASRGRSPAEVEAAGHRLLIEHAIPTAPLVAWGRCADGRSVIVLENLAGFDAADKLIEAGMAFDRLLEPTADLAARLHLAALHHRDLYLCHFFAKSIDSKVDLRLIDAGRVRRLPRLFRRRWIVKDLAQFWYSTLRLPVTSAQRRAWLERYGALTRHNVDRIEKAVVAKSDWIARHDARLRRQQPTRNISLPGE